MSISTRLSAEECKFGGVKPSGSPFSSDDVEPFVVRPKIAWRLLGCSNTFGYELLAAGELESFKDGRARKITVASIKARIARQVEIAKTNHIKADDKRRRGMTVG